MIIEPLEPRHVQDLLLQPSQAASQPLLADKNYPRYLAESGPAYAGIIGGRCLACAGLIEQWHGRAVAWALMASEAGPHLRGIYHAMKSGIEVSGYRRIEAAVPVEFGPGHRWVKMLGFVPYHHAELYTPGGNACVLYERVR